MGILYNLGFDAICFLPLCDTAFAIYKEHKTEESGNYE